MDEILFLSLVTYILFGVAMYFYIAHDVKRDSDYVNWTKEFLEELVNERNIFGVIYTIVLMILILPVLVFLFLVYLAKNLFKRRKNGERQIDPMCFLYL